MTKEEVKDVNLLVQRTGIDFDDVCRLKSYSRQLQQIQMRICNGFRANESHREKWNLTRRFTIYREVEMLLMSYGNNKFYFYHQLDPRGAQIYIIPMDDERMNKAWKEYCYREYVEANPKNFHYWVQRVYSQFGYAF